MTDFCTGAAGLICARFEEAEDIDALGEAGSGMEEGKRLGRSSTSSSNCSATRGDATDSCSMFLCLMRSKNEERALNCGRGRMPTFIKLASVNVVEEWRVQLLEPAVVGLVG